MASPWQEPLARWVAAGLIDSSTATAVEEWEASRQTPRASLSGQLLVALGALLLAAGILLFVAAHWESLSPLWRFSLVLGMVSLLHGLGALLGPGFPAMGTALHAVGSVSFGAGLFLVAQIVHLPIQWPMGLLLWALGAAMGWLLLRQWPQLALLAVLTPAWLVSGWQSLWLRSVEPSMALLPLESVIPSAGLLLLTLVYLAAPQGRTSSLPRRVLLWLGGLALIPNAVGWVTQSSEALTVRQALGLGLASGQGAPALPLLLLGWILALGLPLLLGWRLRGRRFWPVAVAAVWIVLSLPLSAPATAWTHAWRLLGAVLVMLWGLMDQRAERINLGTALVAITVIAFSFTEVMSKLDRSMSLILLGGVCLVGGWVLERLRRRMVARLTLGGSRG